MNGGSSSSQQNKSSPPAEPVAPSTGTASKPETSQRHPGAVFGQKKHTVFSGEYLVNFHLFLFNQFMCLAPKNI